MVAYSTAEILLVGLWLLFLSTLCVLVVQIYRWIRNRYVLVHCWFCNAPNRIHVSARNSFVCSACKQYNGFTPSGDYNKEIPEMYETNCNPAAFASQSKEAFVSHSNVLCAVCAAKQEQKLLELSRFEASANANWDVEIEAFRQNLETRYDLCSPCKAKVRARVLQSDSKVLPDFLSWCQNRRQKSTPPARHSRKSSTQIDESDGSSFLKLLLRLTSFTGWTLLLSARLYTQAVSRLCYVHYGAHNQLSSTLVEFLRRLGFRSDHCSRLVDFKVFAARITGSELLLVGLCAVQTLLVVLHWRRRQQRHGASPKTNPFWILLHTCLLVYSASSLLSLLAPSSSPSKSAASIGASKQLALQMLSSISPAACLAVAGCAVSAGLGVLVWHWLPFCAQDLAQQKQRVQAAWPVGLDAQSVVSQQSVCRQSSFSPPGSAVTAAAAPISSLRNLTLGSAKRERTMGSASVFLRPPLLSAQPPTERCASAVLRSPTSPSLCSLPYSLGGSPTYAASTAPFQYPFRRSPDSWQQRVSEDREEVDSHITSISQRVARQQSPASLASGVSGGRQSFRRRKHHRNTGLLRCCIYFLFGRIDSWADVKAELICLANAVMVATLLMMIVHLFYTLGPALFF